MDDMGWADVGCYGSAFATPNIDALAGRGIRFTHYTTHPICSPARAALLTGRNAHSVATGWLANNNPGFPGYFGDIPLDAPTIAETLRAAGYATIALGKWHNSTDGVSPNPTWPTCRGFDRFYGFLEGETGYFFPRASSTTTSWPRSTSIPRATTQPTTGWTRRSALSARSATRIRPGRSFSMSRITQCMDHCRPRKPIWQNIAANTIPAGTRCALHALSGKRQWGW